MSRYKPHLRGPARLLVIALATLVATGIGGSILGASAATRVITLGSTATRPSCPSQPCQAVGKVTGFQVSSGRHRGIFVAPRGGKIIRWSIRLANPGTKKPSQRGFFDGFYGKPARAGIAVLRRPSRKHQRYRLVRKSPVETLTSYFGRTVSFVLTKPLSIHKGAVVGLTIPTWAPAFAVDLSSTNTWRSSRRAHRCNKASDIKKGAAQQAVGKSRAYACVYRNARLVYSAVLVTH